MWPRELDEMLDKYRDLGQWGTWTYTRTVTTNTTAPPAPAVSEEQIRKIVRQELAELMPIDVPDAPPEDL